jgi:hypothetical protein
MSHTYKISFTRTASVYAVRKSKRLRLNGYPQESRNDLRGLIFVLLEFNFKSCPLSLL